MPKQYGYSDLLVGLESGDDAAVYAIDRDKAIVATTDFFMPIVDDPYDFGRIAATNALSDVYAMGGRPLLAIAVLGMPLDRLEKPIISQILAGGAAVCDAAKVVVGGGHSIDAKEPFYGLAVIGLVEPARIKRNNTARTGDKLILGKGLGIGILSAALKKGKLSRDAYAEMIQTTTKLNSIGTDLAFDDSVHAMTDVTGFGLMGHLMEICRGSALTATVRADDVPLLSSAASLARDGVKIGAAREIWDSLADSINLPIDIPEWHRNLLFDPQTAGGLLVAVAASDAQKILALFHDQDFAQAKIIGELATGSPHIHVV